MPRSQNNNQLQIFSDQSLEFGEKFDPNSIFELITTDKQYDSRYGVFSYSKEDLEDMAKNFNDGVRGVEIAVDLNHDREKKAYAWIKPGTMEVRESTQIPGHYSLYAQLYRYTPEGEELMKTGAYRYFSLEIRRNFTRFVNGTKKTFKNLITGLALTNSPVIKDMQAAYSEPDLSNNHNNNMDALKLYLSSLLAKEIVSTEEKDTMNKMVATLSEEEQEEVKKDVEAVADKPEEAQSDDNDGDDKEDKNLAEVTAQVKSLSEKLHSTSKELAETQSKLRAKELSEKAEEFLLSDENSVGFRSAEKVTKFLSFLNEDQIAEFSELMKDVISLELGEAGHSTEGDNKDLHAKAKELSEKIAAETGKSLSDALSEAYTRLGATDGFGA